MATTNLTMAALGIEPSYQQSEVKCFLKLAAGNGNITNKEGFLAACKKSGHFSFSLQRMNEDGKTFTDIIDANGAAMRARHISVKKCDPIELRNKLYGYASQLPNNNEVVLQLIVDTAE